MSRQNNQVNQTGSKSIDRPIREKRVDVSSSVQDQDEDLKEETVSARVSVRSRRCELGPPTASDSEVIITPGPSASRAEDNTSLSALKAPIKTRYGNVRQWRDVRDPSDSRANSFDPEQFKVNDSVTSPANEQGLSNSTHEVPLLLPPSP